MKLSNDYNDFIRNHKNARWCGMIYFTTVSGNVYYEVKRNLTTAQKEAKILGRLTDDIL